QGDIEKLCKDVQPGEGRIVKCLKEHENELTPACKERRDQMKAAAHEVHEACADDVEKLCGGIQPGGGRIRDCLKQHADQVSPTCKEKIAAVRAQHHGKGGAGKKNTASPSKT